MPKPLKLFIVLTALVVLSGFASWHWSRDGVSCPLNVDFGQNARTVILRLDDVQAYHLRDLSMRMMSDTISRDLPIVAGVIPNGISGDAILTRFLNKHRCEVEIAMHGLDHKPIVVDGNEHGEYAFLNKAEATERTEEALTELQAAALSTPVTFIPPHNELTLEGREALEALGVLIISSLGQSRYDFDVGTWDYATSTFVGAEAVLSACEENFATGGAPCVVMIHPQDFVTPDQKIDEAKYGEYLTLLDTLATGNFVVTRFDWHYNRMTATN